MVGNQQCIPADLLIKNLSENMYKIFAIEIYAFSFPMKESQLVVMPEHGSTLLEIWIEKFKKKCEILFSTH